MWMSKIGSTNSQATTGWRRRPRRLFRTGVCSQFLLMLCAGHMDSSLYR
jgi:hypothetical protein